MLRIRNNTKGFTLVETVIVATLFSIIALGLGSAFFAGMKLWQRAKGTNFSQYDTRITLEKFYRELRQIQDVPKIGFEGSAAEISFPVNTGSSVVKVKYKFNPEEKILSRGEVDLKYILEDKEEEKYSEKKVLGADEFSLSFLKFDRDKGEYSWSDIWPKDSGVFTAVKAQCKIKDEEISKTIFIPISGQG